MRMTAFDVCSIISNLPINVGPGALPVVSNNRTSLDGLRYDNIGSFHLRFGRLPPMYLVLGTMCELSLITRAYDMRLADLKCFDYEHGAPCSTNILYYCWLLTSTSCWGRPSIFASSLIRTLSSAQLLVLLSISLVYHILTTRSRYFITAWLHPLAVTSI